MNKTPRWRAVVGVLLSLALSGCVPLPSADKVASSFSIERQALIEHLAHPTAIDWQVGRLSTPEADRLRQETPPTAARKLQALASNWNASSVGFAATAATGRITGSPAYGNKLAVWLTEKGWVLEHNLSTNTNKAFQISSTDNFTSCQPSMSFDCRRLYVCSMTGNFYAVDLATGTNLSGTPYAMGGTSASVAVAPPPFIDPLASRPDGQLETVYGLTQTGTLYRFSVNDPFAAVQGTANAGKVTMSQSYAIPRDNTAPFTEYFRSGPVIIEGKAVITSWRSDSANSAYDNGSCIYYDTGVRSYNPGTTTGTLLTKTPVTAPVWAPPAVEFDTAGGAITPCYAFFPTGDTGTMVDLASATTAQSVPLLVDKTTPTSGSLSGYPYTVTSKSVTVNAAATGTVSVADDAAETGLPNAWKDLSNLEGCAEMSGTDATPVYGYMKFSVSSANIGAYTIVGAEVGLNCSSASNWKGTSNPKDPQIFKISNYLTDGTTPWLNTNITQATRPPFQDAKTFNYNNGKSESSYLATGINAGNAFKQGTTYYWGVNGMVTGIGTYSFGLLHPELPYFNTASNNGQPFKDSAPQFSAGTSPQLILLESTSSLEIPTMTTPFVLDSVHHRIYAVNTNSLFMLSYASATYDTASDPFVAASLTERLTNFSDVTQTYFSLTSLGQSASAGPTATIGATKTFVANIDPPMLSTNGNIYVIDNHPTDNNASFNRFTPPAASGTAPLLAASNNLTTLAADALAPASGMVFDESGIVIAGTYDSVAGNNTGRAWILSEL